MRSHEPKFSRNEERSFSPEQEVFRVFHHQDGRLVRNDRRPVGAGFLIGTLMQSQ